MSFDPNKILKELQQTKTKIDNTLKFLSRASQSNDAILYRTKYNELTQLLGQFETILNRANSVPDEVLDQQHNTNFTQKVSEYMTFISEIETRIPQRPVSESQYNGNEENQPLMSERDLQDQSNLVIQANKDDTEQIEEIVDRMKNLNVAFTKVHTLVEEHQIQIDNIAENIETADQYVQEGNEELDSAAKYQKKASKKLLTILGIVGVAAVIVIIAIVIVCIIKFGDGGDNTTKGNDGTIILIVHFVGELIQKFQALF